MNNMKKLASLLLALVMVLAMAAPAMAEEAEKYTITAPANGHTYEVYQIFTGDLSDGVLSNVKWGKNGAGTEGEPVSAEILTALEALATSNSNTDKLAEIMKHASIDDETKKYGEVTSNAPLTNVPAGYYLIKDVDGSQEGENSTYTTYIVEIVDDVMISPKTDVPEVQKKVDDKNDSNTTEDAVDWKDSADHDIGDDVPFQLKATLADNVVDYLKYEIIFHDTLSKGLTYNVGSAKVYLGEGENRVDVTEYFNVNAGEYSETEGTKITISCENVKAFGATNNSVIIVEYTAELNNNANIGATGNPNEVYLEYSNNPNWGWDIWEDDGDGEWEEGETDDDGDGKDGEDDHGRTPEDVVIVFTYKVVANKVVKNPDYDKDVEGSKEFIELTGAGFTLYKKNAAGEYVAVGEEVKGADMTTFEWIGLDDGDYKIEETTTPAGYNTIAPIEFTITAEHELESDDPRLTALNGGDVFSGEVNTGAVSADIENVAGATLPETGGMGTTVIYALGCLLVAGAAVMLFAKKRAASK